MVSSKSLCLCLCLLSVVLTETKVLIPSSKVTLTSFCYYNDIDTELVNLFGPTCCKTSTWYLPVKSNLTFTCSCQPKANEIIEFNGAVPYFPYFIEPMCFVGSYVGPIQNISRCILV